MKYLVKWPVVARLFLLVTLLSFVSAVKAEDRVLQVWKSDGTVVSFNLDEVPVTTYSDGNLVIKTTKTTVTYPLEQVRKYTYSSVTDALSAPKSESATLSQDGETLTFTGLKSQTQISVYNVSGQLVRTLKARGLGKTTVSVANLPVGVYVVKVNGVTYKITKR
jgi:hypothetical protein